VDSQPDQMRGPAFRSDVPEVKAVAAVAEAEAEDEDEDEAEAEAEVKVAPPKVEEPVSVPKKVFKKPAPKK
jgi:hypothetical protein